MALASPLAAGLSEMITPLSAFLVVVAVAFLLCLSVGMPVVGGPETIRPRRAVPCWRRLRSISRRTDTEMRSMAGVVRTTNREW
ncbi:hypothetical protein AB0945_38225 [Streptomyces sp. NPDC005474]|uniref:hypothetical protein n=1 Tax=Streptomyces sp. NPDC005474 TaxID=3154878 RepID=UPI003456F0EB